MGVLRNNLLLQSEWGWYRRHPGTVAALFALVLLAWVPQFVLGTALSRQGIVSSRSPWNYFLLQEVLLYPYIAWLACRGVLRHRRSNTATDLLMAPIPDREMAVAKALPVFLLVTGSGVALLVLGVVAIYTFHLGVVPLSDFAHGVGYYLLVAAACPLFCFLALRRRASVVFAVIGASLATTAFVALAQAAGDQLLMQWKLAGGKRYHPVHEWTELFSMGVFGAALAVPWWYVARRFRQLLEVD